MGLYRLDDGSVVAVGNVIPTDRGGTVSVAVFPENYAQDPMQGFDNHVRVRVGQPLRGKRPIRVHALGAASTGKRGWVELKL
jgi:hypothetical protein